MTMGGITTAQEKVSKSYFHSEGESEAPIGSSSSSNSLEVDPPKNRVDYRPQHGPLLELLWSEEEPLSGQTLYLGGDVGVDGKIYCVPGHGTFILSR